MNLVKRIKNNIIEFFEKPMDYTNKEGSWIIGLWILFVIISILMFLPFNALACKISLMYLISCFLFLMTAVNLDTDWTFSAAFSFSTPYLLLIMLSSKIIDKFVPYRGNDPMKLRAYKVKILIRKTRINKLKFWK